MLKAPEIQHGRDQRGLVKGSSVEEENAENMKCTYLCTHTFIFKYVNIDICIYVYLCMYTFREREREREREPERERDIQTERGAAKTG